MLGPSADGTQRVLGRTAVRTLSVLAALGGLTAVGPLTSCSSENAAEHSTTSVPRENVSFNAPEATGTSAQSTDTQSTDTSPEAPEGNPSASGEPPSSNEATPLAPPVTQGAAPDAGSPDASDELEPNDEEPTAGDDDPGPVFIETDIAVIVDPFEDEGEPALTCDGGACDCSDYSFVIDTKQSCAIEVNPASANPGALPLDAESFITLNGTDYRVFALDRFGEGRVVAWCDGTTLSELSRAMPLFDYLAQTETPKLASVGYEIFCGGVSPTEDVDGSLLWPALGLDERYVEYLGNSLPAEYANDPARLAEDYDGLIVCGWMMDWTEDFSAVVQSFVTEYGKGVALVGEYASDAEDIAGLNAYAQGTGIEFQEISVDWAPTSSAVDLDCVPEVPIRRVR